MMKAFVRSFVRSFVHYLTCSRANDRCGAAAAAAAAVVREAGIRLDSDIMTMTTSVLLKMLMKGKSAVVSRARELHFMPICTTVGSYLHPTIPTADKVAANVPMLSLT